MLLVNMELTPRMEESVEDMTAAATAPNPITDTAFGVKYYRIGRDEV